MNFWIEIETKQIIKLTESESSALKKFKLLVTLSYKKMPNQDFIFYLKRYAKKERKTKKLILKIDEQRMAYVKTLLMKMNYSEKDAAVKSSLFYKHLIGYHEMIRYEKQSSEYEHEVKIELSQFIKY